MTTATRKVGSKYEAFTSSLHSRGGLLTKVSAEAGDLWDWHGILDELAPIHVRPQFETGSRVFSTKAGSFVSLLPCVVSLWQTGKLQGLNVKHLCAELFKFNIQVNVVCGIDWGLFNS